MEEQVAQKSSELEQYLQRVRELEDMYHRLEEALEDERQARQDEETVRKLQARYHTITHRQKRSSATIQMRVFRADINRKFLLKKLFKTCPCVCVSAGATFQSVYFISVLKI